MHYLTHYITHIVCSRETLQLYSQRFRHNLHSTAKGCFGQSSRHSETDEIVHFDTRPGEIPRALSRQRVPSRKGRPASVMSPDELRSFG